MPRARLEHLFNLCCTKLFNSWEIFLFARRSCFWGVSCYCNLFLSYKKSDFSLADSLGFFSRKVFHACRRKLSSSMNICPSRQYISSSFCKKKTLLICNYAKLEGKAGSCLTICHITGLSINYQRSIGNNPRQKQNFWLIRKSSVYSL